MTGEPVCITELVFKGAAPAEVTIGLLGRCEFVVNGLLRLAGVCVRRTRDGRLTLSYPAKDGPDRARLFLVRPASDVARRQLEEAVIGALRLEDAPADSEPG